MLELNDFEQLVLEKIVKGNKQTKHILIKLGNAHNMNQVLKACRTLVNENLAYRSFSILGEPIILPTSLGKSFVRGGVLTAS